MRAAALLCFCLLASCKDREAPARRAARPALAASAAETEASPGAEISDDTDSAWLLGTWQKQGSRGGLQIPVKEWLLFNAPDQVALLAGKPAVLRGRGRFVLHGKYLTLLLPQPTGLTVERYLDVARDHSRLGEGAESEQPTSWVRGSPAP